MCFGFARKPEARSADLMSQHLTLICHCLALVMVSEHPVLHVFADSACRQAISTAQLLCEASIVQAEQLERELARSSKQDKQRA